METLRSLKELTGPALGLPALTFRAWYEAQFGVESWARLDKIPRLQWMDCLSWYRRVFHDSLSAGTTEREKAIISFWLEMTLNPHKMGAEHLPALKSTGLNELEILDLTHEVTLFAWANRLMLSLGEAVFPVLAASE